MTDSEHTQGDSDVPFHGPPAVEPLWRSFVADYIKEGDARLRARSLASLDRLAFCPGGSAEIAYEMATADGVRRSLRFGVEHVALALSGYSGDPAWRPLHRAIAGALANQWTDLRKTRGLYPPPEISSEAGVSAADRDERVRHYTAFVRSPEGALLAGTLMLLHDRLIQVKAWRLCQHINRRDPESLETVRSVVRDDIARMLRAYDPERGGSITTCFYNAKHRDLLRPALASLGDGHAKPSTLDTGLATAIADPHESRPLSDLEALDSAARIRRLLPTLPDKERHVLLLRFGFADGKTYTMEEIAADLGCTRQYIQQLEQRALRRLGASLGPDDPTLTESSGRGR